MHLTECHFAYTHPDSDGIEDEVIEYGGNYNESSRQAEHTDVFQLHGIELSFPVLEVFQWNESDGIYVS